MSRCTLLISPGTLVGPTVPFHASWSVISYTLIDTRYYWGLSENIYRYNHVNSRKEGLGNIHTVNESVSLSLFVILQSTHNNHRSGRRQFVGDDRVFHRPYPQR